MVNVSGDNKLNTSQNARVLKLVDNMTLFDDDLMTLVLNHNVEAVELLLRIILGRTVHVKEHHVQVELRNSIVDGRNITLDVLAVEEDGTEIDIEVQGNSTGAHVKRARFHSAAMDYRMLKKNEDFRQLRDSYVIFIYRHDKFGKGFPIYRARRVVEETGKGRDTMCEAVSEFAKEYAKEYANEEKINTVKNLMKNMKWTLEQTLTNMGATEQERTFIMQQLQK